MGLFVRTINHIRYEKYSNWQSKIYYVPLLRQIVMVSNCVVIVDRFLGLVHYLNWWYTVKNMQFNGNVDHENLNPYQLISGSIQSCQTIIFLYFLSLCYVVAIIKYYSLGKSSYTMLYISNINLQNIFILITRCWP